MDVRLTDDMEAFVQSRIQAGAYPSADAMITKALETLRREERALAEYADEIRLAVEEAERGDFIDADTFWAEMTAEREARRRTAMGG